MLKLGRLSFQFTISNKGSSQFVHYTTSTINNNPSNFLLVDYLINSLGFSKDKAIITSSKVTSLKSHENPNSVVNFLKTNGFNEPQIRAVVSSFPRILSYNVEKTLKPKLMAFHEFGAHGSELAGIISVHPHIFGRALDRHILPSLRVLKSILGNDLIVLEALKKSSWMLSSTVPKNVPQNVALLESYGISAVRIKRMFQMKSRYFALDPKWLQCILNRVEEKIGIRRDSAMFLHGVCVIGGLSDDSLESKFRIFRSFGWTELDILTCARRNPYTLALSESKIRNGLIYFMTELGHEASKIARCAFVLTVSLEKRVIPRNEIFKVLKDKKLIKPDYNMYSVLVQTDLRFFKLFVLPFKDEIPGLYDDFRRKCGAPLKSLVV